MSMSSIRSLMSAWCCCWLAGATIACAGGAGDSAPDAAPGIDAEVCVPGCNSAGDGVRTCAPIEFVTPCALGCTPGAAACRDLVPSNGAARAQLADVSAELRIPAGRVAGMDTDTGEIVDLGDSAVLRGPGEGVVDGMGFYVLESGISVLAVQSLTIERDAFLNAVGDNAIILLSAEEVTIEGAIDLSAFCGQGLPAACAGPGGGDGALPGTSPARGCAPGGDGNGAEGEGNETGAGGGGLGGDGAPGGVGGDGTAPGAGGSVRDACPGPSLVPLAGGSGGGGGGEGDIDALGGIGGGGGGAVQITSFTRIAVLGTPGQFIKGILSNGGGGTAGIAGAGGGGGGAGGGILLEAPEIDIKFVVLTANGGGGGGGGVAGEATDGEDGLFDSTRAAGGNGAHRGGFGGSLEGSPTIGQGGGDATGGGGGGVGIIRFNVPESGLVIEGSTISPAHTRGDPITTE